MKTTLLALLGLAAVLVLATPPQAHAGVFVGVRIGPPPAYGYAYVAPRPYIYPVYRPLYTPRWRAYPYYGPAAYWRHERWEHRRIADRGFRRDRR